jgi:phenylalanyl-tRNA synthetase beta chain
MKLSYNYLSKLIPVPLTAQEMADILTACGLEVEGLEKLDSVPGGLAGLVVGEVKEKSKHPDADRLSCTKVDIGTGRLLDIVCGAANVEAGQKVIVAPEGTLIHPVSGDSFSIRKSKIRGQLSEGMICAEDEIGLGHSHEGIMVLPSEVPVGTVVADYFQVSSDYAIEINITPNRPDAASHIGAARDILAKLLLEKPGLTLNLPTVDAFSADSENSPFQISIENSDACRRYGGIYLTDVQVGESPEWLKQFLRTAGLRPINNVVDITNFVMLETGQPLHAFDAEKIQGGKISIKHCAEGTTFLSLDGVERKLSSEDLMICDAMNPLCMAGIMGGAHSGVSATTRKVFLESARFEPSVIRRSGKRHGLKTDSSFRFERGTDPEATEFAAKRAALLIKELCGARIASGFTDRYPEPFPPRSILLRRAVLDRVSGMQIPAAAVQQILEGLGCSVVSDTQGNWQVGVPLFKTDVTREIDLVEEVMRIYGYDLVPIPGMVHYQQPAEKGEGNRHQFYTTLANHLASSGYREILTHSLFHSRYSEVLGVNPKEDVAVLNPISAELDIMRQTMAGSGLMVVAANINRRNLDLKLFEFGKTYRTAEGVHATKEFPLAPFREQEVLAFWFSGNEAAESWRNPSEPVNLHTLKAAMETVFFKLGIREKISFESVKHSAFSEAFEIKGSRSGVLGMAGQFSGNVLKAFDIKAAVFYAELSADKLFESARSEKITFRELPRFPHVRRDLALLLDKAVTYAELEQTARKTESNLLKEINLFDVYEGKHLPEGKKSYALSFILRDEEKTLTDEAIEELMSRLVNAFEKQFGAELRK